MSLTLNGGLLLAVEGIDGAGKTTQAQRLAAAYSACGFDVVTSKEPTNGRWGKLLRQSAANGRLPAEKELDAFVEDRREHVGQVLRPALQRGAVVIVDRYYLSTAAYQGARGFDEEQLLQRNEEFAPTPDLAVLLTIPPAVGVARIRARGDRPNAFEDLTSLERVAAAFDAIDRPYVVRVDGTLCAEDVTEAILESVGNGPLFRKLCLRAGLERCEPFYCSHRIAGACEWVRLRCRGTRTDPAVLARIQSVVHDSELSMEEKLETLRQLLEGTAGQPGGADRRTGPCSP